MPAAGVGCYDYRVAGPGDLAAGQEVHVLLAPEGAVALTPTIGPNATTLDGQVVRADATSVTLAVTQITRVVGPEEFMQHEPVTFPRAGAAEVTVRQFDAVRTVLATVGIAGAALAAGAIANQANLAKGQATHTGSTR